MAFSATSRAGPAVDGQRDGARDVAHQRVAGGCELGAVDLAGAIRVTRLDQLQRRDLGLVEHEVHPHGRRLDLDARVLVDREVAQRMGAGGGHDDEHEQEREQQAPHATGSPSFASRRAASGP